MVFWASGMEVARDKRKRYQVYFKDFEFFHAVVFTFDCKVPVPITYRIKGCRKLLDHHGGTHCSADVLQVYLRQLKGSTLVQMHRLHKAKNTRSNQPASEQESAAALGSSVVLFPCAPSAPLTAATADAVAVRSRRYRRFWTLLVFPLEPKKRLNAVQTRSHSVLVSRLFRRRNYLLIW